MRALLAIALLTPALATAQEGGVNPCDLVTKDEVASMVGADAAKVVTRSHATSKGAECSFLGERQKSLMTVEVRPSKLPKYDLDQEAESLQKIYRTSLQPVDKLGDGAF